MSILCASRVDLQKMLVLLACQSQLQKDPMP
jgi:hypothetical protein